MSAHTKTRWVCVFALFILAVPAGFIFPGATGPTAPAVGFGQADTQTPRHFCFIFRVHEYNKQFEKIIGDFFEKTYRPGDILSFITPVRVYNLDQSTLQQPQGQLIAYIKKTLLDDLNTVNAGYNDFMDAMKSPATAIAACFGGSDSIEDRGPSGTIDYAFRFTTNFEGEFTRYRVALSEFNKFRTPREDDFLQLGQLLEKCDCPAYIFIFYQKECRPIPHKLAIVELQKIEQTKFKAIELFDGDPTAIPFKIEKIKELYMTLQLKIGLIYVTTKLKKSKAIQMVEHSRDIYNSFVDLTKATGGMVENVTDPAEGFNKIKEKLL